MKNGIFIIAIIFFSFLSYCSNAQNTSGKEPKAKNYIISNISYPIPNFSYEHGSTLGVVYHRMFSNKFGANISYSKTTIILNKDDLDEVENAMTYGENIATNIALYNSGNIGFTYRTTAGKRQVLLGAAGLNYKSFKHNATEHVDYHDDTALISKFHFSSFKEFGFYASLDYLFFITDGFAIGIHGATEVSPNMITNVGGSLAYRF